MKKISLIIILFLLSDPLLAQISDIKMPEKQGKPYSGKSFSATDLMRTKRLGGLELSPDGKEIIFSVTIPSIRNNSFNRDIYVSETNGDDKAKPYLKDAKNEVSPKFSPDGKQLAFLANFDNSYQIYVKNYPDGDAKKITNAENGVSNFAWSPDGKNFLYTSEVKVNESVKDKYPNYPKAKVRIYDDLPIRHWDHWIGEDFSHIFVIPASGGQAKDLMKNQPYHSPSQPWGGIEDIAWSPDSKEIAYTSKKVDDYELSTNTDIYLVDPASGNTSKLTKDFLGFDKHPSYSPDGKYLAFTSQERAGFEADKIRIMLYDRNSKTFRELTKDIDQWVYDYIWSPDSKYIYASVSWFGKIHIFRFEVATGKYEQITDGPYKFSPGLAISPDGKTLYFGRQTFAYPVEYYKMPVDKSKQPINLTNVNYSAYMKFDLPEFEEKKINSFDGSEMYIWIVYPPDFDENKQYPLITYCQGGPQSMISPNFHYRWNLSLMASKGYVIVAPNRRGLPGFGQAWNDAISKDWGGAAMSDIMAATDYMFKQPYIDRQQSCAIGASAGGYAAFWLAGHHKGRYHAFLAHCGVFNFESMYGSTEEIWFPNWEYGGPYWEAANKKQYEDFSPHKYVQNWDTPIIISTGEYDFRVPYTQSLEAFTAAQLQGIDSKIIIFPDETHFIAHPQEFIIWDSEIFKFLDKYTKK